MNKLITIIIPVYNVEPYLRRCLNSVINQTYNNLEIILIDDGSTDSSGKICDEYALKDNRIKVIHKQNGGLSSARNAGLDIATGDYIGFVDGDDWIEVDMFEHLKHLISINETLMSECNVVTVKNTNKKINNDIKVKYVKYNSEEALIKCFTDSKISNFMCNKLFHKSIFYNIRHPKVPFEDMAIMYKLIDKAKFISRSFESKYYYYIRPNSLTNEGFNYNKSKFYFEMIEKILKFCRTKKWNNAYTKIKAESIYMKAYCLKILFLYGYIDKQLINVLRKEVLNNIPLLLKGSKPFYKKLLMIIFCLFFKFFCYVKWNNRVFSL